MALRVIEMGLVWNSMGRDQTDVNAIKLFFMQLMGQKKWAV